MGCALCFGCHLQRVVSSSLVFCKMPTGCIGYAKREVLQLRIPLHESRGRTRPLAHRGLHCTVLYCAAKPSLLQCKNAQSSQYSLKALGADLVLCYFLPVAGGSKDYYLIIK